MQHDIRAPSSRETVDKRLARLAAARHGVFSRRQAEAAGATRSFIENRLRTTRWEVIYPGVYRIAGTPASWRQHLLAACIVSGMDAAASHRAAAALRGLPGGEAILEIAVPRGRRVRRTGIIIHEIMDVVPADLTFVDAIRATSATRTLIDLAAVVAPDTLEEALDEALRRRMTRLSHLRWRVSQLEPRGRRGVSTLRSLVEARTGSGAVAESVLETRFLRLLRRAGLPPPTCQHEVRDRGRLLARVDFAYPDIRLAIEADGYRWHSGRARWEHDLDRRNKLTALGWRVIHVTSADLEHRPDRILRMIAEARKDRASPPGSPSPHRLRS